MSFTEIFSRAWYLFRNTRAIWFLGMLAALLGQSEYGVSTNANQNFNSAGTGTMPDVDPGISSAIGEMVNNPMAYLAWFIALGTVLFLVTLLLGPIALGGLIHATGEADREAPVSFSASLRQGAARFMPVFVTGLLIAIPTFLVIGIKIIILVPLIGTLIQSDGPPDPAVMLTTIFGGILCMIPVILIVSLINLVLYFIRQFGLRYSVLDGAGAIEGLQLGWGLFRRNLGQVLLVWFLLAIGGVLIGLVMAIPAFALLVLVLREMTTSGLTATMLWLSGGVFLYSIAAGIVFGGPLFGFSVTVWTVLYRSLRAREQEVALMPGSPAVV
jgi:hypothetical protein